MSSCCKTSTNCSLIKSQLSRLTIALVGNPNCGKTTIFNALTGSRQKVGNWPGVTVERKSGQFTYAKTPVEIIDLPGTYSLIQVSESGALDERIACDYILQHQSNIIINIVDASHLERHLYLTTQLLEMGVPLILALNMMDVARDQGIYIDVKQLAKALGCPVIALEANTGEGMDELKQNIISYAQLPSISPTFLYPPSVREAITKLDIKAKTEWLALRLLENDHAVKELVPPELFKEIASHQAEIKRQSGQEADVLLANTRYQFIQHLLGQVFTSSPRQKISWTTRLDNIVLNRVLGLPIFLSIMYLLFVFAINVGGAFQDFFDLTSQALFVDGFAHLLTLLHTPPWLIALLADGIGKGINTTVTFIPVIGALFLFLSLLEDSGYMARAAFVIDRLMRMLGLPGKAFVPMIVGFGCNVPAVMSARTLENKRDRILTIMMSPFMSCGARLAIFAVFSAAFFPRGGQNVVFVLYFLGILTAVFTGFLLRKTLLQGDPSPLLMELPLYHLPHVKTLFLHTWQRLKAFIFRAGKLIVPICMLIGALNSLNIDGTLNTGEGDVHSLLSILGKSITPIFAPMGIHADNWPATVGLVTGILAKEVVVGTLNTLYTQTGHLLANSGDTFTLWPALQQAVLSIPQNFATLGNALLSPLAADAPSVNQGVYGLMYQKFDGQVGAFAYLLFVLLYFPCISTMAAMLKELHRGWTIFSACWMTGIAYGVAVIFYQAATWFQHPLSSSIWIFAILLTLIATIFSLKWYETPKRSSKSLTSAYAQRKI